MGVVTLPHPSPSARRRSRRAPSGPRSSPACSSFSPSAIFFMVPRRILPERVLGRRGTVMASLNAATGPIFSRTSATISCSISVGSRLTPALSTMKPHGTSPLSCIRDADHGAFGDVLVARQHLLHAAGREPVPRDIDDVVGAAHDEQVAVLVLEAGVRGLVVAGEFREVAFLEALVLLPQRRQAGGRQRQLDDDRAHLAARHFVALLVDDAHVVARHRDGRRAVLHRQHGRAPSDCRRSPSRSRSATSDRSPASSAAARPIRSSPDRRARRRGTACGISRSRTARTACRAGPPS